MDRSPVYPGSHTGRSAELGAAHKQRVQDSGLGSNVKKSSDKSRASMELEPAGVPEVQ
jgi:hypothetical protein